MTAFLVAGLSYGDEGKGASVDYLCRHNPVHTVVRYNGGAQCAHNVCTPEGKHFRFSQFGSGTLIPKVRTHLSRYMLVNPLFLMQEEQNLRKVGVKDAYDRLTVERRALVTNPFQIAVNRIRETVRDQGGADYWRGRHGSCGMGIGETMSDSLNFGDALRIGDLENPEVAQRKLETSRERKLQEIGKLGKLPDAAQQELAVLQGSGVVEACLRHYKTFVESVRLVDEDYLTNILDRSGDIVFEGAQGILLDQDYGWHPHTTWTDITFSNADKLLADYDGPTQRIGIMRCYTTRHGPGPFVTESSDLIINERHNTWGEWQRSFRVGHFDLVATRYALEVLGGVDEIFVNCIDHVDGKVKCAESYTIGVGDSIERLHPAGNLTAQTILTNRLFTAKPAYSEYDDVELLILVLEDKLDTPITLGAYGPTAKDRSPFIRTHVAIH